MTQSTRKFIGTFLTLIMLVIWCWVAVAVYLAFLTGLNTPMQLVYFAVAGLGWALPTMVIIRWMVKPES